MTLIKDELVGAWRFVSAVEVFDDGERRDEFGPHADGYLTYSTNGVVSAVLGDRDRPRSGATDPQRADDEDRSQMAKNFIAYAGPYTVDPTTGTVIHHLDVALFPGWQGGDQERHVRLNGDLLRITGSPRTAIDGRTFRTELTWNRVRP